MFSLYKNFLSPLLHALLLPLTGSPHACRFTPTCSVYARQALHSYGIIHGGYLTLHRFLRCQPLSKGGYDPLPQLKSKTNA